MASRLPGSHQDRKRPNCRKYIDAGMLKKSPIRPRSRPVIACLFGIRSNDRCPSHAGADIVRRMLPVVVDNQPLVYSARSSRGTVRESQALPIDPSVTCARVIAIAAGDRSHASCNSRANGIARAHGRRRSWRGLPPYADRTESSGVIHRALQIDRTSFLRSVL